MKRTKLSYILSAVGLLMGALMVAACVINPAQGGATATPQPATPPHKAARSTTAVPTGLSALHVSGNRLLNEQGQPVILRGVNRSGTEYVCLHDSDIFNGPSDAASVQAIKSWHVNAVRIPLNEDCWLGINGISAGGANYQNAIIQYVHLLNRYGIYAIVDLHWVAPGSAQASSLLPMPDANHAPAFWQSVASTFQNNAGVLFDLFNEPYPDHVMSSFSAAWKCWRDGGQCAGISYTVAGYQQLVNVIRGAGAKNVLLLAGLGYAASLPGWLTYEPVDPQHNLAASWHIYNKSFCHEQSCWDQLVAPLLARVPLIAGEIGETDCNDTFVNPLMSWLDQHGASYLAWTWTTVDCTDGPALITSYNGTPTPYGVGVRDHLSALPS